MDMDIQNNWERNMQPFSSLSPSQQQKFLNDVVRSNGYGQQRMMGVAVNNYYNGPPVYCPQGPPGGYSAAGYGSTGPSSTSSSPIFPYYGDQFIGPVGNQYPYPLHPHNRQNVWHNPNYYPHELGGRHHQHGIPPPAWRTMQMMQQQPLMSYEMYPQTQIQPRPGPPPLLPSPVFPPVTQATRVDENTNFNNHNIPNQNVPLPIRSAAVHFANPTPDSVQPPPGFQKLNTEELTQSQISDNYGNEEEYLVVEDPNLPPSPVPGDSNSLVVLSRNGDSFPEVIQDGDNKFVEDDSDDGPHNNYQISEPTGQQQNENVLYGEADTNDASKPFYETPPDSSTPQRFSEIKGPLWTCDSQRMKQLDHYAKDISKAETKNYNAKQDNYNYKSNLAPRFQKKLMPPKSDDVQLIPSWQREVRDSSPLQTGEVNSPRASSSSSPTLMKGKLASNKSGRVMIYFDNDNLFINTQRFSARNSKYKSTVINDPQARVNMGKFLKLIKNGREIKRCKLYGSEPPPAEKLWRCIERCGVEVSLSARSNWTSKEKKVDTQITADAVEDVITLREEAGENRTLVLVTGDWDLAPVVEKALFYGWKVEIWSYDHSLSNKLKNYNNGDENVTIHLIEEHFDQVTFTVVDYKRDCPVDRTIVLTYKEETRNVTKKEVNRRKKTALRYAKAVFQLPVAINHFEKEELFTLAIVFTMKETGDKGNYTYDFNKDVWEKINEFWNPLIGFYGEDGINIQTLVTYKQTKKPVMELEIYSCEVEETRRQDQELGLSNGNNVGQNDQQSCSNGGDNTGEDEDEWHIVQGAKKPKKKSVLYSDHCRYQFRCREGPRCKFTHTQKEKTFFQYTPDQKDRVNYKKKNCYRYEEKSCPWMLSSHICSFAHGPEDVFEFDY